MSPDTRSTILPAVLFALTLAFDVLHAVLDVNRLEYWSLAALRIGVAALILVGVPAAAGFFVLSRLLSRRFHNGTAVALTVAITGIVLYGLVAALRSSETSVFLENHLGFTCFLSLALLALWRRPKTRLALLAAFAVGVAVTVAAGGRNVSYASVQRQVDQLRLSPVPFGGRLLLLGVDGLGWDTLQRWAAAHPGEDYAWFRERAVLAPLNTLVPTLSPRIWSSIATGVPPEDHGVVGFTSLDYPGLWHHRLLTPRFEGAFYWTRLLEELGAARRLPVSRLDLRKPPIWEILGRPAYPVDVLAWWATWPAQPLPGRMVSDRFYFSRSEPEMDVDNRAAPELESPAHSTPGPAEMEPFELDSPDLASPGFDAAAAGLTFPPGLAAGLAPLRRAPEDMTDQELARFLNPARAEGQGSMDAPGQGEHDPRTEIRYAYTSDETWFRIATKFLDNAPRNSTMLAYFRGVDMVSHGAMRFSHLYPSAHQADHEARQVYGEVVCRYYSYAFARLRELIEKAGEDSVVLIVSDHGFEPSGEGEFGHYHAPQGVFLALGGGRAGVDTGETYHVYDVAPTLLWLRGYPAGEDMPGRAHDELFPQLRAAGRHTLETYGYRVVTPDAGVGDARTDAEMMRLLKTLGYVK
jgi:predicted AlkP superfamily phosphohydrolase/phosphomutase